MVPSNKSKRTKKTINSVPRKSLPLVKAKSAEIIVPSAPIAVIALAEIPRRNKPLQIGVINLVTGARNDS
jgi:hypothetical protein